MIRNINLNKKTFIRWKVYIDRARMYIGYINFLMILVIFMRSIKDSQAGQFVFEYYYFTFPVLFILFFIISLILGYMDSKLGFREEELRNLSVSNPVLMEILKSVKELREEKN